jgi:hypothetical protein
MRTKTNIILAAMACADLGFILFSWPEKFIPPFADFDTLQKYRYYFKDHIIGLINCFSAASAW